MNKICMKNHEERVLEEIVSECMEFELGLEKEERLIL